MKNRLILLILVLMAGLGVSAQARFNHPQQQETLTDPVRGFEEILDLWRDGRFSELYERTIPAGNQSKETFIARLSVSYRRPACCWLKLQEAGVLTQNGLKATLAAKVGLEAKDGSTEYITRRFKLQQENGVWKVSMSDITALSGKGKKRRLSTK
jgi:hypothetical protein